MIINKLGIYAFTLMILMSKCKANTLNMTAILSFVECISNLNNSILITASYNTILIYHPLHELNIFGNDSYLLPCFSDASGYINVASTTGLQHEELTASSVSVTGNVLGWLTQNGLTSTNTGALENRGIRESTTKLERRSCPQRRLLLNKKDNTNTVRRATVLIGKDHKVIEGRTAIGYYEMYASDSKDCTSECQLMTYYDDCPNFNIAYKCVNAYNPDDRYTIGVNIFVHHRCNDNQFRQLVVTQQNYSGNQVKDTFSWNGRVAQS